MCIYTLQDDSGYWGTGGLFTAISIHSKQPKQQYELAAKMKGLFINIFLHTMILLDKSGLLNITKK